MTDTSPHAGQLDDGSLYVVDRLLRNPYVVLRVTDIVAEEDGSFQSHGLELFTGNGLEREHLLQVFESALDHIEKD